jgi:hypothetical protein
MSNRATFRCLALTYEVSKCNNRGPDRSALCIATT